MLYRQCVSDIIYSYKGGRDYAIVNIAKAPLVITAEDKCVNYLEDIPQFTVSYDGFVNDDNENILDELPQIICDVTNEALPGVYEIILKGGYDNNYEYILVNGIKDNTVLDDVRTLNFTATLKEQELGKYDNIEDVNHINYLSHIPFHLLRESFVQLFDEFLEELNIEIK